MLLVGNSLTKNSTIKFLSDSIFSGPRDKEAWVKRLKEEYMSLIAYVQSNKESDSDW